ncbi:MAG: sugar phosphate nucleotidyltransferase [Pirellulales bacterium]
MKVVLFCGGFGMRLRDYSEETPKPLVNIGYCPIIWHLMKYYAHFGHCDFILCLGYKADCIKKYFLNYDECLTNNFVMEKGGNKVELLSRDIADWRITFAETDILTNIGGRLQSVRENVKNEDVFLANYTDNLSDADLGCLIDKFLKSDAVAGFLSVRPNVTYHLVQTDKHDRVLSVQNAAQAGLWTNGGFFIFRQEIFEYLHDGEELVEEPFQRLIEDGKLVAYRHDGFWACMDTFKEKQQLDDLFMQGKPPWQVWETDRAKSHDAV